MFSFKYSLYIVAPGRGPSSKTSWQRLLSAKLASLPKHVYSQPLKPTGPGPLHPLPLLRSVSRDLQGFGQANLITRLQPHTGLTTQCPKSFYSVLGTHSPSSAESSLSKLWMFSSLSCSIETWVFLWIPPPLLFSLPLPCATGLRGALCSWPPYSSMPAIFLSNLPLLRVVAITLHHRLPFLL